MTSKSDAISKCNCTDEWVVDIFENFLSPNKDLQKRDDDDGVSICKVPKWLSSEKPEAFIPQFVGLGPYHHYPELIMTDKMKLATAKRALKHFDNGEETLQQHILKALVSHSDFQPFYHIDMMNSPYNYQTLLYIITVDGLFLLGLIHTGATANSQEYSNFLSGKHGMAVVNAGGAQLTMDFIIRDVFMLENQIPIYFLKKIAEVLPTKSNEIQSHEDLGLSLQLFCEELCPFVYLEDLSKNPEAHYHLLDLMYHLILSELDTEPEPEPKPPSPPQSKPEPEPEPPSLPQSESKVENDDWWIIRLVLVLLITMVGIVVGIVILIPRILFWILKSLFRMVSKSKLIRLAIEALYDFLSKTDDRFSYLKVKQWAEIILEEDGEEQDTRPAVTIPSVMELHNAGIHFRPSKASISSIEFNVINRQFYLPVIKLDVNSDIIIKNLVAYESLTKSKDLIFTRYVEIMRAIIKTPYDVKMLVYDKIIHTDLSDEVVVQLFDGMSKSIRPSKSPKLDKVINKVIANFESTQALNKVLTEYIYSSWKFFTVLSSAIFLLLTVAQTYCTAFGCAHTSN